MEKMVVVVKCLVLQRVGQQWAADGCMALHVAWQCWGGGRVQQLGAASQQCHDLITRCNEWNQPLVRTTTNTFSWRHFILNLIVSFDSGRWWHNCEIAGWEPEDESWAAILQPLSSIYQDPGPEPDIIRFTLHPPSPDYHQHQLRGGGEEHLLLWFLIFFGECWTTHARAQFNLNLC